ncbi:MAG: FtsH protease activity modulator HflK [Gammaproteobacteria bacterium]|nr:FtsH protease activity modulator HflK [Gammaproteobacteria bacterium]
MPPTLAPLQMAWNEPNKPNRDPWNPGSGGRGRPPDLDSLFKKLRQRLPGGKPPPGSLYWALAAAVVLAWLFSGFYVVDAQEQAVELSFGRVVGVQGPGLGWHLPWPLGTVRREKVGNIRQVSVSGELLTADRNLVDITLTVQYRIDSLPDFLFSLQSADDTLGETAKSVLRQVVVGYNVDAVLGDAQQAIAGKVKNQMQKVLDRYHSGLAVTDASLSQVQPPDAVKDAFADAIKAADDEKRIRNQAEAYAKDRLPRAKTQAAREIADAKTYREQAVAQAQGQAVRFDALLGEYRKAPQITRQRLYLETLRQVFARSRVVLVDAPGETVRIELGPLPPAPTSPAANGEPAVPASSAPAPGQTEPRS